MGNRRDIPGLLRSLGITLPSDVSTDELMDVMDTDGSGDVSVSEILTGAGMLRREQLEMAALAAAFKEMAASRAEGSGDHELSANYLAQILEIPSNDAEDLVLLADIDRFSAAAAAKAAQDERAEPTMDIIEFHRLVVDCIQVDTSRNLDALQQNEEIEFARN